MTDEIVESHASATLADVDALEKGRKHAPVLRPLRFAWIIAHALVGALSVTSSAGAAEPSAADRETSRSLYAEGMRLLDAHDYTGAEHACGGAHALIKAPTSATCWARALEGLGRLVEARDVFLEAVRFPVASDEPSVFTAARATSRAEADSLSKRIPSVTVVVSGPPASVPLHVTIDGASVPAETARLPRKTNPGAHAISVTARGFEPTTVDVQVSEGEDRRVDVALQAASSATPADASPPTVKQVSLTPFVVGGVGIAGLAFGIVTGILAESKHSTLASECKGGVCAPSDQGDVNSFHTLRTLSTVGYVVGAVGLAGGVVLWLLAPSSEHPAVGLHVGPSTACVIGAF
jgi:hypothetical protein